MTENINLAVQVLLVGMVSVFLILGMVVGIGRSLIYLVNRFSPAPAVVAKKNKASLSNNLSPQRIAVLTAVVDRVTNQKGIIKSIQKI